MMQYPAKNLPVLHNADVVVCGAGPAGLAAAVAAARAGRRVVLIEQTGVLGGMGTAGLVPAIIHMTDGVNVLAKGICLEVVDALARRMNLTPDYQWQNVQPEVLKSVYDELVVAAGVTFYLGLPVVDVIRDGTRRLAAVVVATRQGLKAVRGTVFVDATGDANLAAWADVPCDCGDAQGRTMSPSLCVQYAGIDWETYAAACQQGHSDRELWQQQLAAGTAPVPEHHFVGCFKNGRTIGSGNLGHVYGVNALRENDLTRGYVEGRQIARQIHGFYRDHVPGFEQSELVNSAALLSVRETRRIRGDYVLGYHDYLARASFADEIGRFAYPIDIHASSTDSNEQQAVEQRLAATRLKPGESYGIPYRALIPATTDNLLVAGRCLSCDREIQSSLRVMPGCFITGQAAGVAAALACAAAGAVRHVAVPQLQQLLRQQHAFLRE